MSPSKSQSRTWALVLLILTLRCEVLSHDVLFFASCRVVTVAFMALLILIKSITNQYDSPNIAYYCGNAFPWYYEDGSSLNVSNIASSPLLQCLEKPSVCSADNYYKSGFTLTSLDDKGDDSISIYSQYGYVDSSASFGVSTNPFYSEFELLKNVF